MRLFRSATRFANRFSLLATIATLAACSSVDGGDDGTPTSGTVKVAASNPTPTISATLSDVQFIQVTRSAGYDGTVALAIDSLPTGVTAAFEPAVLPATGTTALLTLSANSAATIGTKVLKVRATAVNAPVDSLNITVNVVAGAITIASSATGLTVAPGATGSLPIVVGRLNGFAGAVNLIAEGLPTGVIATFAPALLPNGSTASTLSLAVPAGTATGASAVTVRARSTGVADQVVQVPFVIQPIATSDFSLSASAAALSFVAGASAQSTITVSRFGGFTGNLAFTLTGAPAGLTAAFSPNPVTGTSSTLTLTSTAAVVPGTYNAVLTATATTGGLSHTLPITIQVTQVPGIAVKLLPDTVRLAQSGFAQTGILMTRLGNFTGDFYMSVTGLPTGVSAGFGTDVVLGNATNITFAATSAAVAGTYNVAIRATAGSDVGSATLVLIVGTAAK